MVVAGNEDVSSRTENVVCIAGLPPVCSVSRKLKPSGLFGVRSVPTSSYISGPLGIGIRAIGGRGFVHGKDIKKE